MSNARNLADLLDSTGDVKSDALDNVPAADVVNDTTPQLGGDLDTNGSNINFSDNVKAQFGASNDLQIYHTGSYSTIHDSGTGNLSIKATDLVLGDSGGNAFVVCTDNGTGGEVALYHNAVEKLTTTSTGVSVTGTVAATAFSGDGSALTGISGGFTEASYSYTSYTDYRDYTGFDGYNTIIISGQFAGQNTGAELAMEAINTSGTRKTTGYVTCMRNFGGSSYSTYNSTNNSKLVASHSYSGGNYNNWYAVLQRNHGDYWTFHSWDCESNDTAGWCFGRFEYANVDGFRIRGNGGGWQGYIRIKAI